MAKNTRNASGSADNWRLRDKEYQAEARELTRDPVARARFRREVQQDPFDAEGAAKAMGRGIRGGADSADAILQNRAQVRRAGNRERTGYNQGGPVKPPKPAPKPATPPPKPATGVKGAASKLKGRAAQMEAAEKAALGMNKGGMVKKGKAPRKKY